MKYCQRCGRENVDGATFCAGCGNALPTVNSYAQPANPYAQPANPYAPVVDESVSAGLVVLSVLFPIFGLIYWPVKAKTRPRCAKTCGIAALISWGISFLIMMV